MSLPVDRCTELTRFLPPLKGWASALCRCDQHLLDLDSFRGVDIVEPRTFYEELGL